MQFNAVRSNSIMRKLAERGETLPDFATELDQAAFERQLRFEDFWQMLIIASKAESAINRAIASGEPAHVAKYAFQLAQAYSNFYHSYPVLTEENREKRTFLLWMTTYFRSQLERTLGVLGIAIPEYM
ncbi:MAG TPA: DALR anticodon-binding domain-containing protein [Bryobacteraceae bacterium]|nr:DALR anticodon-binding domain-containing protein [Bryobacteraceae bacterium]